MESQVVAKEQGCWQTMPFNKPQIGVANGKIRALPRRRDPSLKIRARDLNLFVKSEPET